MLCQEDDEHIRHGKFQTVPADCFNIVVEAGAGGPFLCGGVDPGFSFVIKGDKLLRLLRGEKMIVIVA